MKTWFTARVALFAGMVSLPATVSPRLAQMNPAPDYRQDPRLNSLKHFFQKWDCPAWRYAAVFLEAADFYDLDWRLLPSISYIESTGGKAARYNNWFGWDSGRAHFPSTSVGIRTVARTLSQSDLYRDKSTDQILALYNPDADYAQKVKTVMRRISPSE